MQKTVLVIEDTIEVRENICEILELSGYNVISADNGIKGVRMAHTALPDLILCDVMMPELDGFGVLKILNSNGHTAGIPLIFLTARAEQDDFRKGMGLGADDYISKPFDDVQLLEAISMRLQKNERLPLSGESEKEGLCHFFSASKAEEVSTALLKDREVRLYHKKDVVYDTGRQPRWLYYVVSGKVKQYQTNDFGKELITGLYGSGTFFGYDPVLLEDVYINSVVALEDTQLKLIPKEEFTLLVMNQRDFAFQLMRLLAMQVKNKDQHLIDMAYSSVRYKVAQSLLSCLHHTDSDRSIQMSREDLASIAGTAKETLIRTLSEFRKENLISIEGSILIIKDIKRLREISQ